MRFILPILVTALCMACQSTSEPQPGRAKSADGTVLHYAVTGQGNPAIVLVHGWCMDHSYWDKTVKALQASHRILTLDLAGHGQSDSTRKDYTIPAYAQDVLAAMDAAGIDTAILVGHSMSGDVILEVNRVAPDRVQGLIGVDNFKDLGTVYKDTVMQKYDDAMEAMSKDYEGVNQMYVHQYLFPAKADTTAKARVLASILNANHRVAINTLKNLLAYGPNEKEYTQELNKPLHLIDCTYQPIDTTALKQYAGGGYYIYSMPGTGHYPMIEAPEEFVLQLKRAIKAINEQ